jgi:choline dehydrogenase-like flavoprotein
VFSHYDRWALSNSRQGFTIYRTLMIGGTTVVSCGNGVRVLGEELKCLGIDLSQEFEEAEKELGIAPLADHLIGPGSKRIMDAANRLGFEMGPMPKYIDAKKCVSCGLCILGCRSGAKWSAVAFVEEAVRHGAKVMERTYVRSIVIQNGKAVGLRAVGPRGRVDISAKKIIIAAGGIGSPALLRRSGIEAGNRLFADLYNVTYGVLRGVDTNLQNEPSMAALSTKFKKSHGFVMAPFIDAPFFIRLFLPKLKQLRWFRYKNLLGIMVKMRDENIGKVTANERFEKKPTAADHRVLDEGARTAEKILIEAGVKKEDIMFTKPKAAHPGGSCAIGEVVDMNLKTKIDDLYVCDASVLPTSPGAPPILTIVALAKRFAKNL